MGSASRQRFQNAAAREHLSFESSIIRQHGEHRFSLAGFGYRSCNRCSVATKRLGPCASAIEYRYAVPRAQQTLRNARTHASSPNKSNVHESPLNLFPTLWILLANFADAEFASRDFLDSGLCISDTHALRIHRTRSAPQVCMAERVGFEPSTPVETVQLIDFTSRWRRYDR